MSENNKKILVIIPHLNNLSLIKKCLMYLERQTLKNFDVLVIDNGSDDESPRFLHKWSNEKTNGINRHVIYLSENTGFAHAVNLGFNYSIKNEYDFSVLLNNDAFVDKFFIENLYEKILSNDRIFAVSSLMLKYDDSREIEEQFYNNTIDSFGDNYSIISYAYQNMTGEDMENARYDIRCFSACGGASIYRNIHLIDTGFLDERFFAYLEDVDLSYRANILGLKIVASKDAKCVHVGSATSGGKYNSFKVRLSSRNNIYLIYKNMPFYQMIINMPFILAGIIVKQIYFIKKGFGLDYFFGLFDGMRGIHKIERCDFSNISIFRIIKIEIDLIINLILYVKNFLNRKIFNN